VLHFILTDLANRNFFHDSRWREPGSYLGKKAFEVQIASEILGFV
jgi:hypothetical protein